MQVLLRILGVLVILVAATMLAFMLSPRPGAWVIRQIFDRGGQATVARLAPHVLPGIDARLGLEAGPGTRPFDLYRPRSAGAAALPAVVWVHGGAFVAGQPSDVGNYLKILAAEGYATVAAGYTLAPDGRFPQPVAEVNALLGHLRAHAGDYGIDPDRIVLAGDSAGAQIAAQLATVLTSPGAADALGIAPAMPASSLKGAVLFCGPYDLALVRGEGVMGLFLGTVLRAYGGSGWAKDPLFARFSVPPALAPTFPPAFVSVGNADPLATHSYALADRLAALGVPVTTLFFPKGRTPPLGHEYQFDLDGDAGRTALADLRAFLRDRLGP